MPKDNKPTHNENVENKLSLHTDQIVVLPFGAHEQHGPHLPFETDTIIANGICTSLIKSLPKMPNLTFLPTEDIGYSMEHTDVLGTKSLTATEAIDRWLTIIKEQHDCGVRKMLLLNAHGGNSPFLTILATEARARYKMLVVATSWTRFGVPESIISPEKKAVDIHGGEIETSVMLALRPDLVDMKKADNFPSRQTIFTSQHKHLRAYGPHAFGWMMSDLNPNGVAGDASAATAEKGEQLITHAVQGLRELIIDINNFDLSIFDRP